MSQDQFVAWMERALDAAEAAAVAGEVPVGAVLVNDATGQIVSQHGNAPIGLHDPTAHAEIRVIREAAGLIGNYRLQNHTLVVTLEPCAMCAAAIANARLSRVIFGATDAKGGAVVSGVRWFGQPTCHWRPNVVSGVLADRSAELLRRFFASRRG